MARPSSGSTPMADAAPAAAQFNFKQAIVAKSEGEFDQAVFDKDPE